MHYLRQQQNQADHAHHFIIYMDVAEYMCLVPTNSLSQDRSSKLKSLGFLNNSEKQGI